MNKIFFFDRLINLAEKSPDILCDNFKFYEYKDRKNLFDIIQHFEQGRDRREITIFSDDLEKLQKHFISYFKEIKAAGGIVRNKKQQFLGIKRLSKWDLPKGKAEKGEKPKITALREVSEECGLAIHNLEILRSLTPTYHFYNEKGKKILKTTYWFEMMYNGITSPIPQLEENIVEARWFNLSEIDFFKRNTYFSLVDVMNEGLCF